MKTLQLMLSVATLSLVLAGCSGGSSSSSSLSSRGTVAVSLTDAPACGYDHVYVTVSQVGINSSTDGSGSWTSITLPTPKKIDLLSLTNGALESLGQTPLTAGTYQQLRLVLSPNVSGSATLSNSVVPTCQTAETPLTTPSAVQSGIKVNTRQPFTVEPGTLVDLVLDFNACASIVKAGNSGKYLLKPVITATTQVVSGSIDGYVDSGDAGALVYAEQAGVILHGTVADSSGHFVLSPLEDSAGAGNYDVVIANAGKATDIIAGVPVTAGATTTLSTQAAPLTLGASDSGTVSGTVNPAAEASLGALQNIGGLNYAVAATNADASSGAYAFTLPVAAPELAAYTTTLPLTLTPVAAAAGQYTITALSISGQTASSPAAVTAGATTTVDFPSLQ